MIVDRAVYDNGERVAGTETLGDLSAATQTGEGLVWLELREPTPEEIAAVAREFDLHPLALEDAVHAHQRPKLERFDDTFFLVLRPARYEEETDRVVFGELHVFVGPRFVITISHGAAADLSDVRKAVESRPELLRRGPMTIVHGILDFVVDQYTPVVEGFEDDIDEIETAVFSGTVDVSRRTYELIRGVIDFRRATQPLNEILAELMKEPKLETEERRYLRDVHDHALRVEETANAFHELLRSILSVNLTLETKALSAAGNRQNEEVKKISAWAAILFAPTLVGTVYGMNFKHMPELNWTFGYPMAVGLMLAASLSLYVLFRRRNWI